MINTLSIVCTVLLVLEALALVLVRKRPSHQQQIFKVLALTLFVWAALLGSTLYLHGP